MSLTVADSRRERPTTMPTAERGGAGVPRRVAFWLLALVAALGLSALSTAVFILAPDPGALLAARIMSGLSARTMVSR